MSTLVIGIGNRFRGDDGAGLEVARRLRALAPERLTAVECEGDLTSLAHRWADETVIVVDAVEGGGLPPGTVYRLETGDEMRLVRRPSASSHGFGVLDALALASALGCPPRQLVLYGIEVETTCCGEGLSAPVSAAVHRLVSGLLSGEAANEPWESGACV